MKLSVIGWLTKWTKRSGKGRCGIAKHGPTSNYSAYTSDDLESTVKKSSRGLLRGSRSGSTARL